MSIEITGVIVETCVLDDNCGMTCFSCFAFINTQLIIS